MANVSSQSRSSADLARHGLRATRQRVAILDLLRQSTQHPTAIDLHQQVLKKHPNISRKTVYEVLDSLMHVGLASCVTGDGPPVRYETYTDPHYHARCRVCGRLFDLPAEVDDQLRRKTPLPKGFSVEHVRVTFEGHCARCRKNA